MALSTVLALLQETPPADAGTGTQTIIKIVSGLLAVVLVVIIIMRRRGGKKKSEEEEF